MSQGFYNFYNRLIWDAKAQTPENRALVQSAAELQLQNPDIVIEPNLFDQPYFRVFNLLSEESDNLRKSLDIALSMRREEPENPDSKCTSKYMRSIVRSRQDLLRSVATSLPLFIGTACTSEGALLKVTGREIDWHLRASLGLLSSSQLADLITSNNKHTRLIRSSINF